MAKVLIVYASRTGDTEKIAQLIAEGIRISGVEANVVPVKDIRKDADLQGYDAYVFGSPTYHGDMLEKMKTLLWFSPDGRKWKKQEVPKDEDDLYLSLQDIFLTLWDLAG